MEINWPSLLIGGAIGVVGGLVVRTVFHWFTKPRRSIRCKQTYCYDAHDTDGGEDISVICISLQNCGNDTANNVQFELELPGDDKFICYDWYVDNLLYCERLTDETLNEDHDGLHLVRASWAYLNAGDEVQLIGEVKPLDNPDELRVRIDANNADIKCVRMQRDCRIEPKMETV
ncbi:MAG: hypothetical protein GY904_02230 [Planctomycetaceae bacterium]|nr:hypothetical protein [Planctomycetaceae bacterium]